MLNLVFYSLAAVIVAVSLWHLLVGGFDEITDTSGRPQHFYYDENPIIASIFTGGLWTLAFFLVFTANPQLIGKLLSYVPFAGYALIQWKMLSDVKTLFITGTVLNGTLAFCLRKLVKSQTEAGIDLPPAAIEAWQQKQLEEQETQRSQIDVPTNGPTSSDRFKRRTGQSLKLDSALTLSGASSLRPLQVLDWFKSLKLDYANICPGSVLTVCRTILPIPGERGVPLLQYIASRFEMDR